MNYLGREGGPWCGGSYVTRKVLPGLTRCYQVLLQLEEHKILFRLVPGYHSINGPLVDAIKEAMDDTTPQISLFER